MRLFGQPNSASPASSVLPLRCHRLPASALGLLSVALLGVFSAVQAPLASAQTAPYVIPYIVSTYAGPHAEYSGAGQACAATTTPTSLPALLNGAATHNYTLDTAGDGCLLGAVSIGADPHDIRVGPHGDVFWLDDNVANTTVVHRANPFTNQLTIAVGSLTGVKDCLSASDAIGDNCPATDGAANSNLAAGSASHGSYTGALNAARGLGIAPNGDMFIAGYSDYLVHRVAASTLINGTIYYNFMISVMGTYNTKTTPAGSPANPSTAAASTVYQPRGVSGDAFGNVFVADTSNFLMRGESAGTVTDLTATGSSGAFQGGFQIGTPFSTAKLYEPEDVQLDSFGNLYIADEGNKVIYGVYKAGTMPNVSGSPSASAPNIFTIAGAGGSTGTTAADYALPSGGFPQFYPTSKANTIGFTFRKIGIGPQNDVYITDYSDGVIWFLDHATGYVRVLAGNVGSSTAHTGCTAPLAGLGNGTGDGCPGAYSAFTFTGAGSGIGASADPFGNLYFTDPESGASTARIRKMLSGLNFPSTAAGSTYTNYIDLHFAPGDTPAASSPYTLTTNGDYTFAAPTCNSNADTTQDCILPVTFTPTVTGQDNATLQVRSTSGGVANFQLTGQGTAAAIAFDPGNTASLATIANSQGVALDGAGNAYIADTGSNRVLYYNATTKATTVFAGGGSASCSGATDTFGDGCQATATALNKPSAVAIDPLGNVYIADTGNNIVRRVAANGVITLFAGGGTVCAAVTQYTPGATDAVGDGCLATQATLSAPAGLAADYLGNLYIADTGNNLVREVGTGGFITVLAGGGTVCSAPVAIDSNGDGCAAANTTFNGPTGLFYDSFGQNIVVADTGNSIVRKIYLGNTFNESSSGVASNILFNPVTLVAGNGQAGSSVDANNVAVNSQLNKPTGVAVDASGTVYIADTGNHAVRLVSAGGTILTIGGILGASGTGTLPASAIVTQFNSPAALAVLPTGTLYIADSGNNRLLSDTRSQITYNFGRTNDGFPSPVQNITALNIGTTAASLPSPIFTENSADTQLTLVAAANSNSSVAACAPGAFASAAICNLQGQFNPTDTNSHSANFVANPTNLVQNAPKPTITLQGQGAVLTTTTSTVSQTTPATGNAQYGATLTLTATASATQNTAAISASNPSGEPTQTIIFIVDGTAGAPVNVTGSISGNTVSASAQQQVSGLSVGPHTISCQYSGDFYYAGSVCTPSNKTITVVAAGTNSTLSFTNNNQPQFTSVLLSAQVNSTTIGVPTGSVVFLANGTPIISVNGTPNAAASSAGLNSTGLASLTLSTSVDANGNVISTTTLVPGTYTLSCQYTGATNYAASLCPGKSFTVNPQAASISLTPKGCLPSSIYAQGTTTPLLGATCPNAQFSGTIPVVATAQGSTTDATLFITPTNTVNGTLTFSCSGLPANSTCTFQPTSITLTAGTTYASPVYTDVTLWTDLQPGAIPSKSLQSGTSAASIGYGRIGWPLTLLSLMALFLLRRKKLHRGFSLLAMALLMAGSALTFTGCAGPGNYTPTLTPTGTYPVTVTATGAGVSSSTVIDFTVTGPGIAGQE